MGSLAAKAGAAERICDEIIIWIHFGNKWSIGWIERSLKK